MAYPLAGLVGWSRLHDRKHWPSDVLAGAAIGFGIAWKMEDALRADPGAPHARLEWGAGDGPLLAVRARW